MVAADDPATTTPPAAAVDDDGDGWRYVAVRPMKRCPAPHHDGARWVPVTPRGWYLAPGRFDGLDGWCRACRIADSVARKQRQRGTL